MSQPTAQEQLTLEYINFLRTNPGGEYARLTTAAALSEIQGALNFFGVNMTALQSQLNALAPVAPLAWNNALATAARTHNGLMIQFDQQSHQLPGEASLSVRIRAAGYENWNALGENVFAFSTSPFYGHAGFVVDWGYDLEDLNGNQIRPNFASLGDGIQDPPGHRNTLTSPNFTEIGIAITAESNPNTEVGPLVTTHELGNRFDYQAQFLGVIINDTDNDNFYDIGEGMAGVTVTLTRGSSVYTTTSWNAGGWQMSVPAGTYQIVFSGGGLSGTVTRTATLGTANVKIDAELADATGGGTGGNFAGGSGNDTLTGTAFADVMNGNAGNDILNANGGNDSLNGGVGADTMRGGAGDDSYLVDNAGDVVQEAVNSGNDLVRATVDYIMANNVERLIMSGAARVATGNAWNNTISGTEFADTMNGNAGNDILIGNGGNDVLNGGIGIDTMRGGLGDDAYLVDNIGDVVEEAVNSGNDLVRATVNHTLAANVERLIMLDGARTGTGNASNNAITGTTAADTIMGLDGNDVLRGNGANDLMHGGAGDDLVDGGAGRDTLTGGAGRDMFEFRNGDSVGARNLADVITDFSQALDERIQLALVDANSAAAGNQDFEWIGTAAFGNVAGQLRYQQISGNTYIEGDLNGDGASDYTIALRGLYTLDAGDFTGVVDMFP